MTDQAFDDLCEAYEKTVSPEEYAAFRDSLHEETGKVSHPFIMGSLDKMKAEEPRIAGIEWGEPSKDGRLCPVAVIEPVEIGGSTITRVTLHNADWIRQMGLSGTLRTSH